MSRWLSIASTWPFAACMPVLPLPPVVDPEPRFGMVVSSHHTSRALSDSVAVPDRMLPQLALYASVAPLDRDPNAVRVRLSGFIGLANAGFDVFAAAPDAASEQWDAGVGFLMQPFFQRTAMPYASVGRAVGETAYVWFTQGAAHTAFPDDSTSSWVSSSLLALRFSNPRGAFTVFAAGILGHQQVRCSATCPPVTRAYVGVSTESAFRRRRGVPRSW